MMLRKLREILRPGLIGGLVLTLLALATPSSTSVLTQTEVAKLLGRLIVREDVPCSSFGNAIAIDDDTAIIGAVGDCELDWFSGAAYVFVRDSAGDWEEQTKLLAYNGGYEQGFGWHVDIDGDTVIVGDWEDDLAPANSAYVFVRDQLGQWTLQTELTPSATSFPDYYGWDIAIDGDTALVGAPGPDNLWGEDPPKPGRVYVYVRDGSGIWTEQTQLFPNDSEPDDFFGGYVDLDGDTAIATRAAGFPSAGDSGPVYVFTRDSSGLWSQQAKLVRSLLTIASQPGPVALDGDTAVMLTRWEPSVLHGLVHVFARDSLGNWAEESVIDIGTNYEEIALDGNRIVVTGGGAADVYTRTNSTWSLSAKLAASDLEGHQYWYWFGRSVGMDGDTVFVDGPSVDEAETAGVYVFKLLEAVQVTIDIKPGNTPNSINPSSKAKIPVAILTTESFDALSVDPLTVQFGPDGATEAHKRWHVADVDEDGDADLLFHFNAQESGIVCGHTEATLTGETIGGNPITGTDSIKTVPCR